MINEPQTAGERSVHQLFDLSGRVALVTGGCGHLGASMCRALAEANASVVVTSRDASRARELAESLPKSGSVRHVGIPLDYLAPQTLEASFDEARALAGHIDVLVNNGHEPLGADWTTIEPGEFTRQLGIAAGYFFLSKLMRNDAVQRGAPASIIMLGSMYGLVGSYPDAYAGVSTASPVAYHVLKGGIVQMTRHLAVYWAKDGVRVNCLCPGPFPSAHAPKEMVARLCRQSPLGRMGRPEELKGAVVFLASDASSYMTGQNLVIDGGWTAW